MILQKFIDGVYNCTCTVANKNNIYNTSHAFDYDSHFKQLGQKTCCDALTDTIMNAPICVLDKNDSESKENW